VFYDFLINQHLIKYLTKTFLVFGLITLLVSSVLSQSNPKGNAPAFKANFTIENPGQTDVFVKNRGQFDYLLKDKLEKATYVINCRDQFFLLLTVIFGSYLHLNLLPM